MKRKRRGESKSDRWCVPALLLTAGVVGLGACGSTAPLEAADPNAPDGGGGDATCVGCADAGSSTRDGAPSSPPIPDGGAGCLTPPTGDWTGTSRIEQRGSGGGLEMEADVRWTLVASEHCVDRYQPSGTARFHLQAGLCTTVTEPDVAPIAPDDGALIIDRSTSPATYQVTGSTSWDATIGCDGEEGFPIRAGGGWAGGSGSFEGAVISGDLQRDESTIVWLFQRTDAVFPPPAAGACSEPPTDRWTGTSLEFRTTVAVTWNRVATQGCVDRFAPMGVLSINPALDVSCLSVTLEPPPPPVVPADGVLEINRATNPPSFRMNGATPYTGTARCIVDANGTVEEFPVGSFAWATGVGGVFDGDTFSGSTNGRAWSLTRQR